MNAFAHDLWVFGYGSLMWRPGFVHAERVRARLVGYSRRFCVTSVHHRGSAARPGLVLGLDRGGVCEGVAYRVQASEAGSVIDYLRAREQVNGVYREALLPVEIEGHAIGTVRAVTFLVERAHPSYAGHLSIKAQAQLIRGARGRSGVNLDYVINTLRHMVELGIRERELERLMVELGGFFARDAGSGLVSPRAEVLRRVTMRHGLADGLVRRMRPDARRRFGYRQKIGAANSNHPNV
jgi:cation transport protein ChaC